MKFLDDIELPGTTAQYVRGDGSRETFPTTVQSIVSGNYTTVDDTDPENPVVDAKRAPYNMPAMRSSGAYTITTNAANGFVRGNTGANSYVDCTLPKDTFTIGTTISVLRPDNYYSRMTVTPATGVTISGSTATIALAQGARLALVQRELNKWDATTIPKTPLLQNGSGYNSLQTFGASATGNYTSAVGYGCGAYSAFAVAFGYNAVANNYYSAAFGVGATASHDYSCAIGHGATTTKQRQTMIGDSNGVATFPGLAELAVYTVAGLPSTGVVSGAIAYASNARKPGEGAGAGTGMPVFYTSSTTTWYTFDGAAVTS